MRYKMLIAAIACFCVVLLTACGSSSNAVSDEEKTDRMEQQVSELEEEQMQETAGEAVEENTEEMEAVVEPRKGDFRVGFWGDTKEVVQAYETSMFVGELDSDLLYQDSPMGYTAYVCYKFDQNGGLYLGAYQFTDEYNLASTYISRYNEFKGNIIAQYGEPELDIISDLSGLAKYAEPDVALQLGYVGYATSWKTDTTEITLGMVNPDGKIGIVLKYESLNHEEVHNTSGL